MKASKMPEVRTCAPTPKPAGETPDVRGDVPLSSLRSSPTNPRKSFPEDGLQQLAASFAEHGILQPLLVRPMGEKAKWNGREWRDLEYLEVVAGERRLRAARIAGLDQVPAIVRHLTDAEVLEVQLIENDQREDVKPSEQVAAYARLVGAGKTIDDVVAVTGKGIPFVRSILALAKLPANVLKAVDEGKLPRRTAELVARVPGDKARAECAAFVLAGDRHGYKTGKKPHHWKDAETMTCRQATEFIAQHFQVELKQATFDRKALDLVGGVGSCDECPKRAGNDPDAKAAGTRADVCLDPPCFHRKTEAHGQRVLAAAKEKGQQVLSARAAEKVFSYGDHLAHDSGYVDLEARCLTDTKSRRFKQILKDVEPEQVVVAIDPNGKVRELLKQDVASKSLRAAGIGGGAKSAVLSKQEAKWKAEQAKERKLEEARKAAAVKACGLVAEAIEGECDRGTIPGTDFMHPLVVALIEAVWNDASRLVAKRRELGKGDPRELLQKAAGDLSNWQLFVLAAELLTAKRAVFGFGDHHFHEKEDKEFWKAFDIDPKKLVKEAQAEQKKPAAKKGRPSKGEPAKSTEPAYACEAGNKKAGGGKLAKASTNGHKPGCPMPAALADATPDGQLPHGIPRKLVAKSIASIPGFPPALAAGLAVEHTTTDVALSERANKEKGSHRDRIKAVLSRVPGTYEEEVERGTEAFLNYLYPGRKAKQLKADQAAPKPRSKKTAEEELEDLGLLTNRTESLPVTAPVGNLRLRDIDGFPAAIATKLEKVKIVTLSDLEPKVHLYQSTMFADRPLAEVVYQTIVRTAGGDGFNATSARDALMKHLQPGWAARKDETSETEESPQSKPTRKEKGAVV